MTDFLDNPFQMDEEMSRVSSRNKLDQLVNKKYEGIEEEDCLENEGNYKDTASNYNIEFNKEILNLEVTNDNPKFIRSKISQIKLEDTATDNATTEDDNPVYEEDMDDKFDYNLQKKIEENYQDLFQKPQPLTPPENFAPVINNIYRSSFPQPQNFSFLKKLKLKSILCLIPEEYPSLQLKFLEEENIKLFQLGMSGNKEPFVEISSELITEAVKIVLNTENQPILIHCNRGKHRTGCLVGVLRRLQEWSLTIIFDEYRKFAAPKERPMDQQFIELYDETEIVKYCENNELLPIKWD